MSGPETAGGRRLRDWLDRAKALTASESSQIERVILAIEAEARSAAVAPLETVIRDAMATCPVCGGAGWVQETRDDGDGNPEPYQAPCWDAEHSILARALLSAPSPVREPEGLDVAAEAAHNAWYAEKKRRLAALGLDSWPSESGEEQLRPWSELSEPVREFDRIVVRAILAATPERPADEVDG